MGTLATTLLNVFGGVALFIYGMTLMSDALGRAAGERMRSILHFFSRNRFVAVIAGTVVTAIIQSSSASTVMVIGFVNAGLLNLAQSVGIIFGANIGTTVTAQIVAFDVHAIVMPSIIVGLLMHFIRKHSLYLWGDVILGFGLLFLGMNLMSDSLRDISNDAAFRAWFATFDCAPVNGVIPPGALFGAIGIGLAVTLVIQSSSATSGIVIAMGGSGLINLYTAVALILGSNIGTTITAQLAAIPANRVAKQAALAHTLFNVIGVCLMTATFWITWGGSEVPVFLRLVNYFSGSGVEENIQRHIANAHTLFNVITTLVLLPFIPLFVKLCEKLLPIREKKIRYQRLEPNLLNTPVLALEQVVTVLRRMTRRSWKMIDSAWNDHFLPLEFDGEKLKALAEREEKTDRIQFELNAYLVEITRRKLTDEQSQLIPQLMHCVNDAERIADHAERIVKLARQLKETGRGFSGDARKELAELYGYLTTQADATLQLLENYRPELLKVAARAEQAINELHPLLEERHIERLNSRNCAAEIGLVFIEIIAEIVHISGRLSNIVERSAVVAEIKGEEV